MSPRSLMVVGVLFGIAGGIAFALTRSEPAEPEAVAAPVVEAVEPAATPPEVAAEESGTPEPMTAKDWEAALGGDPEWVSEEAPPPATGTISMPIAAKLAPEPMSAVPHELIGAWDDRPDSERPGAHRAIVAVVEPNISDTDLEQLVWDIRERHAGAEILDVRVYDSADAAKRSSALDGGAERARHLVAGVKRNDRLGYDEVTVRGRVVGP